MHRMLSLLNLFCKKRGVTVDLVEQVIRSPVGRHPAIACIPARVSAPGAVNRNRLELGVVAFQFLYADRLLLLLDILLYR